MSLPKSAFHAYKVSGIITQQNHKKRVFKNEESLKLSLGNETKKKKNPTLKAKKNKKKLVNGLKLNVTNDVELEPVRKLKVNPPMFSVSTSPVKEKDKVTQKPGSTKLYSNSIDVGRVTFSWLMSPTALDTFYRRTWEKTYLHLERDDPKYFINLVSMERVDQILRENRIEFTKNLDVTSYENGERKTHNPEGRAFSSVVWDYYRNGCSIRFLNPQTFIPQIHELTAALQEYFQCMTGANLYLTPPNSQGKRYTCYEKKVRQV